jgi:Methane oxygenase PmoA
MFDFEVTLHASHGDVTFGDTKEGAMAVRLAESMRLKTSAGQGHIVTSTGVRDNATWGKRAEWCDYSGPVDGKLVGIAIFDHPQNPRHPTWWHVRDYGLFAANPFGKHDFEKLHDPSAGNLTIPSGQTATFRYRFILHTGDEIQAKIAQQYTDYSKTKP